MNGIIINHDMCEYFTSRGTAGANSNSLKELARNYCRGQVTEVLYNIDIRCSNVAGMPGKATWLYMDDRGDEGVFFRNEKLPEHFADWIRCIRLLDEMGIDPYAVWLQETKRLGRKASLTIRMNDVHYADDPEYFYNGEFWRSHLDYRIDPVSGINSWPFAELDYSRAEVREYALNYIRAILDRYDCDGLELDWMRFGHHFAHGRLEIGRPLFTEFHRHVRQIADEAAKRLGHHVEITVRVPANPTTAWRMGYDVMDWVQENLVDGVTVTAFVSTDTDMPLALWRRMLGNDVAINAGLESAVRPFLHSDSILETAELLAAQAANYLHQGADCIYLYNHMDNAANWEEIKQALEIIGSPETTAAAARRHVMTFQDMHAFGDTAKNHFPQPLPDDWFSEPIRIAAAPRPEEGRTCRLILGFDTTETPHVKVWLNNTEVSLLGTGVNIPHNPVPEVLHTYQSMQHYPSAVKSVMEFDCTGAVAEGANIVIVKPMKKTDSQIVWAEISIEPR